MQETFISARAGFKASDPEHPCFAAGEPEVPAVEVALVSRCRFAGGWVRREGEGG